MNTYEVIEVSFELNEDCGMTSDKSEIDGEWVYSNSLNLSGNEVDYSTLKSLECCETRGLMRC